MLVTAAKTRVAVAVLAYRHPMLKAHCPECQQPLLLLNGQEGVHPRERDTLTKYSCTTDGCAYKSTPGRYVEANPDAAPSIHD